MIRCVDPMKGKGMPGNRWSAGYKPYPIKLDPSRTCGVLVRCAVTHNARYDAVERARHKTTGQLASATCYNGRQDLERHSRLSILPSPEQDYIALHPRSTHDCLHLQSKANSSHDGTHYTRRSCGRCRIWWDLPIEEAARSGLEC